MIKNYLLISLRTLRKHKLFSFINILGLSTGIAASVLLMNYVAFEWSFDRFHTEADRTFRMQLDTYRNGVKESGSLIIYYGAGPAIKEAFPEVETYVRLHRADGMINYHSPSGELISHHERKSLYADSTFFDVFSFPLIDGDPAHLLRNPSSVVISESAAKKYFGNDDPIGKTITLTTEWKGGEYTVEGIFRDVPQNSHLQFDFLFAIENLLSNQQFKDGAWYWANFYTYVQLKRGSDAAAFEKKLPMVIEKHLGQQLRRINTEEKLLIQPIADIHLQSELPTDNAISGNYKTVSFLLIISFLIVGIAWINYVNLSTARASERAREVGMRKVMGSGKRELILQFMFESTLLTTLSLTIATMIVIFATPYFNGFMGIGADGIPTQNFQLIMIAIAVIGTFLAGLYPAFVMSSFKPLSALKGKSPKSSGSVFVRRGLVILQFASSVILIVAALTIYTQLSFMRNQDLGMTLDQKVVVRSPKIIKSDSYLNEMSYFKQRLKSQSAVTHITSSSEVPGKSIFWTMESRLKSENDDVRRIANVMAVDEEFIPAFDMKLIAGRNFSQTLADLNEATIVNEAMLLASGFTNAEEAIGQELLIGEFQLKRIIGVVKNFHQQSLHEAPTPIIFYYIPWVQDYITFSMTSTNVRETMGIIQQEYKKAFPDNAFNFFFLDDQYNAQYTSDERSWKAFIFFSMLSIVIACLGLFGLSSFVVDQRSKEIAIRKVLGASSRMIAFVLSKEFLTLVVISIVLAAPLSWLLMNEWLQDFAFRIDVPWWSIGTAAASVILIAWVTISYQTIKASMANPVDAIKEN
jgi:putative ABC transport system permease protein